MSNIIEIPDSYLPTGVSGASFDPDLLRAYAQAHCSHPFDHDMKIKAWVIWWLLDQMAASNEGHVE